MDYPLSVPGVGLVGGEFVDENEGTGTTGSLIPSAWGNAVTKEIKALQTAGGQTADEANLKQLALAVAAIMRGVTDVTVAEDAGVANAYVVGYTPTIEAVADGMTLQFKAVNANTAASTLNVDGLGAAPLVGAGHAPLQGGEILAGGICQVAWRASIASWVLLRCSGAPLQVAPATRSAHAATMAQAAGVVGASRNLKMSVAAASASGTLTADEIIVESALGGVRYCLPNFNRTINLGTVGAGGMDTGAAPNSGYVGVYAIYNPTTGATALLAVNATAAAAPEVYGGANMPAGYSASALVAVWRTTAGGQFTIGHLRGRCISFASISVLGSTTSQASYTPLSIAGAAAPNVKRVGFVFSANSTAASSVQSLQVACDTAGSGVQNLGGPSIAAGAGVSGSGEVTLATAQTIYYQASTSGGTPSYNIGIHTVEF